MRNGESTSKDLSIKCLLITKGKKGKESLPRREGWQESSKPRDQMSEHHQKWDGVAPRALSEDTEGGSRHHHCRCLLITRNVDPSQERSKESHRGTLNKTMAWVLPKSQGCDS